MKIIIIGAKGMLGQELVRAFDRGNEVLAWDREEVDITEIQETQRKLKAEQPNLVINSAAYNDVDGAENNENLAQKINGEAVGGLAEICRDLDIPIMHFSTDYVFRGDRAEGYKEDDAPDPMSAYARSKYSGERKLAQNTRKYYLVRLSRLFGLPANTSQAKRSFIDLMLSLSETRAELEVVDEELSCPTYAVDLAERVRQIIDSKPPFGIYHCANTGGVTWYGFAREIFNISGKNVRLKPVPASHFKRLAARPKYSILKDTKLEPMRGWKEALKEFLSGT